MKSAVLALITLCILSLGACKKDSAAKATTGGSVPSNGWKVGATSHTTAFVARIPSDSGLGAVIGITALDAIPSGPSSDANTFIAYFKTAPTAGGTYRVVAYPGTAALTANQVGIVAGGSGGTYNSTGAGAVDVTVTITGGKLKIVVPAVTLKNITSADEVTATGTIAEM